MLTLSVAITTVLLLLGVAEGKHIRSGAYNAALRARQASNSSSSLQIDLGYEIYQGYANSTSNLNIWKG